MVVATRMVSPAVALLLLITLGSDIHGANGWALPTCQATCGGVGIPYPFGIGADCFRPGFAITCSGSTPFLAGTGYEVLNLSVVPAGARVQLPIAWTCYDRSGKRLPESEAPVSFNPQGVYRISDAHNQLVVVGCDVTAYIQSRPDNSTNAGYPYEYYTGCVAYCRRAEAVKDGRCAGVGCCRVDIPPDLTDNSVGVDDDDAESLAVRRLIYDFSPCSYGFLVERGSYEFRAGHLKMDKKQTMPVWLDWAIRPPNGSSAFNCSDAMKNSSSYACKSQHSSCVDAVNGPGYTCNCWRGYEGNAYIVDGCTDIDECLHPEVYPCYGVCHNTEGAYDCKCKRGSHGNPLQQACDPNFSRAAKISIGVICGISCLVALSIFILMLNEKRKLQAFFERNGGPLLASINNIKIYTKQELIHITDKFSNVLGKGSVGNVYKGTTSDNQTVAVKAISVAKKKHPNPETVNNQPSYPEVDEIRKTEFANEIRIQSQINHKNVVKLLGCCLEVEIPMLVYEFAANGSLSDVLHGTKSRPLSLQTRLDIAVDSAEALAYMHLSVTPKIFHGDVKSGNILLDQNMMAKVCDFGTSRLLTIERLRSDEYVIADKDHLDPVYTTGLLHEKSDVYSYGIVLLELITRKTPRYKGCNNLRENFTKSYATEEKAQSMYDEEITFPGNIEFLQMVGSVAVDCLREKIDDRPSMKEVADRLRLVRSDWRQKQGRQGDQVADVIPVESSTFNIVMDATSAETPDSGPGYYQKKRIVNVVLPAV